MTAQCAIVEPVKCVPCAPAAPPAPDGSDLPAPVTLPAVSAPTDQALDCVQTLSAMGTMAFKQQETSETPEIAAAPPPTTTAAPPPAEAMVVPLVVMQHGMEGLPHQSDGDGLLVETPGVPITTSQEVPAQVVPMLSSQIDLPSVALPAEAAILPHVLPPDTATEPMMTCPPSALTAAGPQEVLIQGVALLGTPAGSPPQIAISQPTSGPAPISAVPTTEDETPNMSMQPQQGSEDANLGEPAAKRSRIEA